MGIIKAAFASASTMAEDQWKEYFYCPAIPEDTIMVRSLKRTSERSANNGSDDIVTDGSIIAVADGEFAIVVSNGKVLAEYKESGGHTFVSGETASVFHGAGISKLGKEFGKRFSFGGDTPGVVQRVYYFNTKEMPGENFSGSDIPFRVKDDNTGLDIDCTASVSGFYTYRVANPMVIYKQLIGNIEHVYKAAYLLKIMSAEVKSILLSSCGDISMQGMRPSQMAQSLPELEERVRRIANEKLYDTRGIELVSFGIDSFRLTGRDAVVIKDIQKIAVLKPGGAFIAPSETAPADPAPANTAAAAPSDTAEPEKAAAPAPKFCRECGAKLLGGKFCSECGRPV